MIDSIHQLTTTIYTIIHCSPPVLWTKTTIKGFYPPVSCETCRCCVLVGVSFDRMMALWDAHPKREVELKAAASARVRLCVCVSAFRNHMYLSNKIMLYTYSGNRSAVVHALWRNYR